MRIAVPSWVMPGTYGDNLRFLEDKKDIHTVELLFFIFDREVEELLKAEYDVIMEYSHRFRYTLHLPDPLKAEHECLVERFVRSVDHFILHPPKEDKAEAFSRLLSSWEARYGMNRRQLFLAENTLPGRLEALLGCMPELGICMDTGHLVLGGFSPVAFWDTHGERIAEIHLHGTDPSAAAKDGRLQDHRPLTAQAFWYEGVEERLRSFTGVVNLENFSWEEVEKSLALLRARALL